MYESHKNYHSIENSLALGTGEKYGLSFIGRAKLKRSVGHSLVSTFWAFPFYDRSLFLVVALLSFSYINRIKFNVVFYFIGSKYCIKKINILEYRNLVNDGANLQQHTIYDM